MKIVVIDDDGKRVASIDDMSQEAWSDFTSASQKLLSDQTEDGNLASMMLLTSFMSNVAGRSADSIFLTGIPEYLMKKLDELTMSVGMGKAPQFLARLLQMTGHDAFHIINNSLSDNRFGHSILFTGIPPETMDGWTKLSEIADLPSGELLGRIMVGGVHFSEEQELLFRKRMEEERDHQRRRQAESVGKEFEREMKNGKESQEERYKEKKRQAPPRNQAGRPGRETDSARKAYEAYQRANPRRNLH